MGGVACSPVLLGHVPGPTGEWIEELTEKPQRVTVTVLSSTTALTSWTASHESGGNSTIVSVLSLTCQKQKESQRLEKHYCTEVRSRSWSIFQSSNKITLLFRVLVLQDSLRLQRTVAAAPFCSPKGGMWLVLSGGESTAVRSEDVQYTTALLKWCFCCGFTQARAAVHL